MDIPTAIMIYICIYHHVMAYIYTSKDHPDHVDSQTIKINRKQKKRRNKKKETKIYFNILFVSEYFIYTYRR